jgi:hypothetical protein
VKKENSQYAEFENLARHLIKVPHAEIKQKLEAEKQAKKRKKSKKSSASGHEGA